jgi:hydroxymethylbilane synthase
MQSQCIIFTIIRNTRLAKLDDPNGPYNGIILAVAGLVRLNKTERISKILSPDESLYAVSQGALGIECRQDDLQTQALLEPLNHAETRMACIAERALLRTLEGGCTVPIGVNTKLDGNQLWMHGLVSSLDGQNVTEMKDSITLEEGLSPEKRDELAVELGHGVANRLIQNGADKILAELANSH